MAQIPHFTHCHDVGALSLPGQQQGMQLSYKTYFYHMCPSCQSNCTLVNLVHKKQQILYIYAKIYPQTAHFCPCGPLLSHVFLSTVHSGRLFHDLSRSHGECQCVQTSAAKPAGMCYRLETGRLSSITVKITGPHTAAGKRHVGPVELLYMIMFEIRKIKSNLSLVRQKPKRFHGDYFLPNNGTNMIQTCIKYKLIKTKLQIRNGMELKRNCF